MTLTLEFLLRQPRRVRIKGEYTEFMISAIKIKYGVIGVKAYSINCARPDKNDHFLLPINNNWFQEIELASDPIRSRTDRKFVEHND